MILMKDFVYSFDEGERRFSCSVDGAGFSNELFFVGNSSYWHDSAPESANWAALSLIYPAMVLGEDLHIDGAISRTLLANLNHDIQSLFLAYTPGLSRIKVTASKVIDEKNSQRPLVATGFSAGVDTFTTLALYLTSDQVAAERKISSLSLFNVGAMGAYQKSEDIFQAYSDRVRKFATENDLQWQTLNSNLDEFYRGRSPRLGFQKTHVIRNIAAAYVFEDLYRYYYYSSTYPYSDINKANDDMAFIEPILLALLETENLRLLSAGAGLARIEKMNLIADSIYAPKLLDVCVGDIDKRAGGNCSRCWKCSRAMVNLDVLGKLEKFETVFDLDYFKHHKKDVIKVVFASAIKGKPADRDLINLMKETQYDTEGGYWLISMRYALQRRMKNTLTKLFR